MSTRRILALVFGSVIALIFAVIVGFGSSWRSTPDVPTTETAAMTPTPEVKDQRAATLQAFLVDLWPDAAAKGIAAEMFQRATRGLTVDDEIANLNASQPEHVKTAGDYVNLLVSDSRIANGRAKHTEYADLLQRVEARYGVEKHVVLAIWGIESAFGVAMGERNVIRSLATLATTDSRRSAFWRSELLAALSIAQRGDVTPEAMTGSWAGAMGHTQFMPSTYLAHAADLDGDGKRDIWRAPDDALASAANYLKVSGWVPGLPSAIEVTLPATGFDYALSAPGISKPWSEWRGLGVSLARDRAMPDTLGAMNLILPAGYAGPAFLTGANFRAILRYNRAVPYALAVGHLAERLAGGPTLAAPWPLDDKALSRAEREALQTLLTQQGHDIGPIDGIVGSGTRAAIRVFQKAQTLPEDGHPSAALLTRLKAAAPK
jgi:membrane-bound lytic murein transglycosylase B